MQGRTLIRAQIKGLLLNQTVAGANIFTDRVSSFANTETPAINILTPEESADPRDVQVTSYIRTLTCNIEVVLGAVDENADDQLDAIALKIEQILQSNSTLNTSGVVFSVVMTGTKTEYSSDGDQFFGQMTISYLIKYFQ